MNYFRPSPSQHQMACREPGPRTSPVVTAALVAGISASAGPALSDAGSHPPGLPVGAALPPPGRIRLHRDDGCSFRGDTPGQHSLGLGASCSRSGPGPVRRTPSPSRVVAGPEPLPSFISRPSQGPKNPDCTAKRNLSLIPKVGQRPTLRPVVPLMSWPLPSFGRQAQGAWSTSSRAEPLPSWFLEMTLMVPLVSRTTAAMLERSPEPEDRTACRTSASLSRFFRSWSC